MALTKMVNGNEVVMSAEEEAAIVEEWANNEATNPLNIVASKKKRIKERLNKELAKINELNDRLAIITQALKILSKYINVTDNADQQQLLELKNEYKKSIDLVEHAKNLHTAVDGDHTADINTGWPL